MGITRYPVASSAALTKAFNLKQENDDAMFLYSSDITQTPFGQKMSKGRLISYGLQQDGFVQLLDDNDPGAWGASQFVIKDVVVKPSQNLSAADVEMIDRGRPGFADAYENQRLELENHQIITLVRFNLRNAIHFSNRFLPEHVKKLVH